MRKPGESGIMETKRRQGLRLGNNTGRLNKATEKSSLNLATLVLVLRCERLVNFCLYSF